MRAKIRQLMVKAERLPGLWWRILSLLILGVMCKSMALAFWDIGAAAELITTNRFFHIGIDFLGAALSLALVGGWIWRWERQKGYHAVAVTAGCVCMAALLLVGADTGLLPIATDLLFIAKYVFWGILTALFWAVAGRFLALRFDSLKFAAVFYAELIGFAAAGGITLMAGLSPKGALIAALFCLMGLLVVFKGLMMSVPMPKETFVKKTDGIRDVFERPLVMGILTLSFCVAAARAVGDAVLYGVLADQVDTVSPTVILSLIWLLFGGMGLVMVTALYHTRYIYTTLVGMLVLSASVILIGIAGWMNRVAFVATAYFIFILSSYFYLSGYLQVLPRPLSAGVGPRLKKMRYMAAEPLGFVLAGIILLNCEAARGPAVFLAGWGVMLAGLIVWSAHLYSGILFRLFKMRLWHGGPLLLAFPRLTRYLHQMMKATDPNDVIYALKTLETANHPSYEKALLKSLRHPAPEIRVFALQKMRRLYRFGSFERMFQSLFRRDRALSVRNQALTNLILLAAEQRSDQLDGYLTYLDNRSLRYGAIVGFLKVGGDGALAAMDVLQRLARSRQKKDNLAALRLMAEAPSPAFVRLVSSLLKSPSTVVVRQALLTAGAMRNPQLLTAVFKALDDPSIQEAALTALHMYGKAAFPPLEKMLTSAQTPVLRRKVLILFLGALPSGEGKQILMRALTIENQKLKKTIVQNILDSGIVWIHRDEKDFLRRCVKRDIERVGWLMHLKEAYMEAPTHETEEAFGFLRRAVQEEIDDTRELILYQLLLLENDPMFVRAVRILLGTAYDLYLPAMGMIQDMLPGRLYQKIKPVLVLPLAREKEKNLAVLSAEQAAVGLSGIILNPPFTVNHWIRATALYALRRLGAVDGLAAAEAALQDTHPVVLEAAVWALVRLQSDKEALHRALLAVPTSRLARISLDEILES